MGIKLQHPIYRPKWTSEKNNMNPNSNIPAYEQLLCQINKLTKSQYIGTQSLWMHLLLLGVDILFHALLYICINHAFKMAISVKIGNLMRTVEITCRFQWFILHINLYHDMVVGVMTKVTEGLCNLLYFGNFNNMGFA